MGNLGECRCIDARRDEEEKRAQRSDHRRRGRSFYNHSACHHVRQANNGVHRMGQYRRSCRGDCPLADKGRCPACNHQLASSDSDWRYPDICRSILQPSSRKPNRLAHLVQFLRLRTDSRRQVGLGTRAATNHFHDSRRHDGLPRRDSPTPLVGSPIRAGWDLPETGKQESHIAGVYGRPLFNSSSFAGRNIRNLCHRRIYSRI